MPSTLTNYLAISPLDAVKAEGNAGITPFTFRVDLTTGLTPSTVHWDHGTHGGGVFIFVSGASSLGDVFARSTDGLAWSLIPMPRDSWLDVAYGNGRFVAITGSIGTSTRAAVSTDGGLTWSPAALPFPCAWQSIAFGAGMFVAVAFQSADYATSPDGITWTARTLDGGSETVAYIEYGNGIFVATGDAFMSGKVKTSPDGITWTLRDAGAGAVTWMDIAFGGGRFFLPGIGAGGAWSSDGITWHATTLPASTAWRRAACVAGVWVCVTGDGRVATTPDMVTWTLRTMTAAPYNGIASSGSRLVAAGYSGVDFASTSDGMAWTYWDGVPAGGGDAGAHWQVSGSGDSPALPGEFFGGAYPSGSVAFPGGATPQTITVQVAGNRTVQEDLSFAVTLSAPVNASISTATAIGTILNDDFPPIDKPLVFLDWSDDRGKSYGNPVAQPLGDVGEYRTSLQFRRLGMARDRVFRLTWSTPAPTALQAAFVDAAPAVS
jgi:hypothetical protein